MRVPANYNDIQVITNEAELEAVCKLPEAIIYITVDWSEPERESRAVLNEVLQQIDPDGMPIFKIDCSSQQQEYFENWLIAQTQHVHLFYTGGYGETLLVQEGKVKDFINYPAKLGTERTKVVIENWLSQK